MRGRMKLSGAGHGYFLQPRIAPSSCPSRAFVHSRAFVVLEAFQISSRLRPNLTAIMMVTSPACSTRILIHILSVSWVRQWSLDYHWPGAWGT
jgi:hypothetical protein